MSPAARRSARAHRTLRARLSRIGVRLLLFNVLAVIMPVAGILYLDVYEQELLAAQERAMVAQARLVAAALSPAGDLPAFDATAVALLARLTPGDARVRVYDGTRRLVADSARLAPHPEPPQNASYETTTPAREYWLYRLGAWVASWRQRVASRLGLVRHASTGTPGALPEVDAALAGRFGAATRATPGQRSLTLTVALPIGDRRAPTGAVSVSQSTYRILQALYTVRLRIFRIVVFTLALSGLISAVLTWTIVVPIRRLRRAANTYARDGSEGLPHFPGQERRDEVGDLARALDELTRRLQAHVSLLEAFAGDLAHEFRNPLASVRAAMDVLEDTEDAAERARFLGLIRRDMARLDRLVGGVRDLARVDSAIERDAVGPVRLAALVRETVTRRHPDAAIALTTDDGLVVRAHPERLAQVIENLVDNAVGFSPAPGSVDVSVRREHGEAVVTVSDQGPGIPVEHRDRVFERFFSWRPGASSARHEHAGLGLAIARAIVDAYGGTIRAVPHDGGARLEVRLPLDR